MRVTDILLEFAPTTPEEDEARLSSFPGQQPPIDDEPEVVDTTTNPAQQPTLAQTAPIIPASQPVAQPVAQPVNPVPQTGEKIPIVVQVLVNKLKRTVENANKLPDGDPVKELVFRLWDKLTQSVIHEGVTSTGASQRRVTDSMLMAAAKLLTAQGYKAITDAGEVVSMADILVDEKLSKAISKNKEVRNEWHALSTKYKLDERGEIVKMDKELEAKAKSIQTRLHMDKKWIRNLIGMFGMEIPRDDKISFLEACKAGTALNIPAMFQDKKGDLENYITQSPPSIKQVYNNVKDTLLDISLSTGQGAATGPFEAMLAIMGGAEKAKQGDLIINGKKYEVKNSSISVGAKGNSNSNAWLDATGEIAPDTIRKKFKEFVKEENQKLSENPLVAKCDFRPNGLPFLRDVLTMLGPEKAENVLYKLHGYMFPSVPNLRGKYDFDKAVYSILTGIMEDESEIIAKEQGLMALLEYNAGKYESGFILYNSSFQKFRILENADDIVDMANEPFDLNQPQVHFERKTVTMGSGRKSSPGIYYGYLSNSDEGNKYVKSVRSSTEWQERYGWTKKEPPGVIIDQKVAKDHGWDEEEI